MTEAGTTSTTEQDIERLDKEAREALDRLADRRQELARQHEATELAEERRLEREEERRRGEEEEAREKRRKEAEKFGGRRLAVEERAEEEVGSGHTRCPECDVAPGDLAEFAAYSEADELWQGYPEPLSCSGCGRVLRFTLKLGDARPVEVGT